MSRSLLLATALYLLFVIYGSLVPLEFNDLPLEKAIGRFKNIPYLNLGAASRADWIANILLYIPLAYGMSALFGRIRHPLLRATLAISVLVFCLALAVAIEFTQLFFPPRTVSLNDLIAETLGTVIGVLSWQFFGTYFSNLYKHLLSGSFFSVHAAIFFYLLFYVLLSLFPFDFVTSFEELNEKLAQSNDALILSLDACGADPVRCMVKLLAEILVLLPLGVMIGYLPYLTHRTILAVLIGLFLGLAIEVAQVFLLSGAGQGISVVTRMVGTGFGAGLSAYMKQHSYPKLGPTLRRTVPFLLLLYIALILTLNGWFSGQWLTLNQGLIKLSETKILPFYYYYYTSEGVALVSLLSNLGMYMPIGLLGWARFYEPTSQREHQSVHWVYIGLLAALFALVVEIGKSFLAGKHTDPSDVWIAFIAAAAGYELLNRFLLWLDRKKTAAKPVIIEQAREELRTPAEKHPAKRNELANNIAKPWRIASVLLWSLIAITLSDYPVAAPWLGLFLIGYTALLFYFPYAWLVVVPALLPVMDFTLWTGRFFFDEFDLLIMTTLAFYFWQKPQRHIPSLLSLPSILLLAVFSLLYCASLFKGLWPLPAIDANAFNNYYSHYNSLRVGKGFIWSLMLLPLFQLTIRRYRDAEYYFAYGILLGLSGVSLFAVFERLTFVSLFDFTSDYRINSLFSTMHAGGGHIESFLMMTLPFITILFARSSHSFLRNLLGFGLFIIALYTLLVTFSRGGYIGFFIGFLVLLGALLISFRKQLRITTSALLFVPMAAICFFMIKPVLLGDVAQHRFSLLEQDRDSRAHHWRDALNIRDNNATTSLFGMGLGSYPRTFFWLNNENTHPATYEIANQKNNNNFLRLHGGDALFLGQYLNIEPHTTYRLLLDLRGDVDNLTLSTSLCEKSIQYSFRCRSVSSSAGNNQWEHIELALNSNDVGEHVAGGLLKRPVQLTFYNGNGIGRLLDIDNVQLLDPQGKNLLANGDFRHGTDFWFFATEKHNPWHIFNFWIHMLFDQGWLGVSAFFLLFANAIYACCRKTSQHSVFAAILISSFSGFMVVGFVDSPFDAPRLTLLFFLLLYFALLRTPQIWSKAQ
jgi:VanZ family protein